MAKEELIEMQGKVDEALFSTAGYEIQDMSSFSTFTRPLTIAALWRGPKAWPKNSIPNEKRISDLDPPIRHPSVVCSLYLIFRNRPFTVRKNRRLLNNSRPDDRRMTMTIICNERLRK